jgi:hypothetical protein
MSETAIRIKVLRMYFSMELGIRLSFVKTSKFQGGFEPPKPPPQYAIVFVARTLNDVASDAIASYMKHVADNIIQVTLMRTPAVSRRL